MINQLFTYKLFAVDQKIEWPIYFDQFIKSDPLLQNFIKNCENSNLSRSLCLGYLGNELRLMILLKYDTPVQIILVQSDRLSFQDQTPTLILYDIKLTKNLFGCQAKLYRVTEDHLVFSSFFDTHCKKEQSHDSKDYPCEDYHCELFPDSYAKLTLRFHNNPEGNFFELKGRQEELLLSFSVCDLIQDPNKRLNTYLEIILSSRIPNLEKFFINKVLNELQKMSLENSEDQNKAIVSILEEKNLLERIKSFVLFGDHFLDIKAKINNLLFSQEVIDISKRIDNLNISNSYSSNENSAFNKFIVFAHVQNTYLSSHYLHDLFQYYVNNQTLTGKTGKIEIIVDHCHEIDPLAIQSLLNSTDLEGKTLHLEKIDFIFKKKKQYLHYSYQPVLSANSNRLEFTLLEREDFYNWIKEEKKISKEFLRQDSFSSETEHFFIGNIQEKVPEKFKSSQQLRAYLQIPLFYPSEDIEKKKDFSMLLENQFSSTLEKIKNLFEEQKETKFILNRIDVEVFEPLPISVDELIKMTKKVVNKYVKELKTCSIETIFIHFRSQELLYEFQPLSIEFNNKLSYRYKLVQVNFNGDLNSIEASIQDRRRQANLMGMIWAYDIPDLLKETAKDFCRSLNIAVNPNEISSFTELDVDPNSIVVNPKTGTVDYNQGSLIACVNEHGESRMYGNNQAGIIVGIHTMDLGFNMAVKRMLIIGDLTDVNHGAISSQECIRVNLAIKYAVEEKIPVDWFTASFGVEINKERGVESLDASASTCREIVKAAHLKKIPINIIVNQVNIGAQSYWDALSTICHDTKGLLIMTAQGSMALTGHLALTSAFYKYMHSDEIPKYAQELYPKGVQSLAGYEDVHGPNSDAMLFANDLAQACSFLITHHYYSYAESVDKLTQGRHFDSHLWKHEGNKLDPKVCQEILKLQKGFKIDKKVIIEGLRDPNSPPPLYLWIDSLGIQGQPISKGSAPQKPETIIAEVQIGKRPFMLVFPPIGPLTPTDSDLIARAISKATGTLPVLIIGKLTGFNSDPLSMQNRQLLHGSLIVKSIVQYEGAILVVNLGDLVGGSFVVFSQQLNPLLRIIAVEGSKAQVIGGNTAAKVVFHNSIKKKAKKHPRVLEAIAKEIDPNQIEKNDVYMKLMREVIGQIEKEEELAFNEFHNEHRALQVGSFHEIIPIENLREGILSNIEQMIEIYEESKLNYI